MPSVLQLNQCKRNRHEWRRKRTTDSTVEQECAVCGKRRKLDSTGRVIRRRS